MAAIYRYEVEAKVTSRETHTTTLVTLIQHAYSVMDAAMQFIFAVQASHGSNIDLTVQRVGPPEEDIRAQAVAARNELAQAMRRAIDASMATRDGREEDLNEEG